MRKKIAVIMLLTFVCVLSLTACDLFGNGGESGGGHGNQDAEYTVRFETDNANESLQARTVRSGESIRLSVLTKWDYTFDGWYESSDFNGTKYTDTYTPTGDATLYAKFRLHAFPLLAEEASDATCDWDGLLACYRCKDCNAYFLDANGTQPVDWDEVSVPSHENHPYSDTYSYNGVTHRRYATCDRPYLYTDYGMHDTLGANGVCSKCGYALASEATQGLKFAYDNWRKGYVVTGIEDAAGVETLVIPSEYDGQPVVRIADSAFEKGYSGIKAVVFPESITSVGSNAFRGLGTACDVAYLGTLEQWCDIDISSSLGTSIFSSFQLFVAGKQIVDLVLPDSVTSISGHFRGLRELKSITFGNNVETFYDFPLVNKVRYTGTLEDWFSIQIYSGAAPFGMESELYIDDELVSGELVVPQSVTEIKDYAFDRYSGLTKVTMHDGVTAIGIAAFSNCEQLSEVRGCSGVVTLSMCAFQACDKLEQIDDMPVLQVIGAAAFRDCKRLQSFTVSQSVVRIGQSAFDNCDDALCSVDNGVYYVGKWAVMSDRLTDVSLVLRADTVGIADSAFSNCGIKEVTIPASLRYMGISAFAQSKLQKATVEQGVTYIGDQAFHSCESLQEISLPNSLNKIGREAFAYSGLETAVLPDSVTEMGDRAFLECKQLKSVRLSKGLRGVAQEAFRGCVALTDLDLAEAEQIGADAFNGCTALETFTLPTTCVEIGRGAFNGCTALDKVHYIGTQQMWELVRVASNNDALNNAVVCEPPVD